MAKPREISDEDEATEVHTVRYFVADLQGLRRLSKLTGIKPGIWLRTACRALIEAFEREGTVTVPFVMVSRTAAEKAGLVPPLPTEEGPSELPPKIPG